MIGCTRQQEQLCDQQQAQSNYALMTIVYPKHQGVVKVKTLSEAVVHPCLRVSLSPSLTLYPVYLSQTNGAFLSYYFYTTSTRNPTLEVDLTGKQRGRIAFGSGQNVPEINVVVNISNSMPDTAKITAKRE